MSNPIRIGIVGLGRAGMSGHFCELEGRGDQFHIVAGYDPLPERREALATKTGARSHGSLEALIADPDVELVDVANRSTDHFQTAKLALEAGKLVLVEKPMTVTHADACRLVDLDAGLGGGRLFVRHNRRFDPDFVHLQEIIASGVLGEVFEVKLRRLAYARRHDWQAVRKFGGGQLLNWGTHIIDHGLQLLGSTPTEVWSDIRRIAAAGDAEDHVRILLRGDSGSGTRIVDIEISGGVALPEPVYSVYGTRGALTGSTGEFTLRYLDPDVALAPVEVDLSPPEGYGTGETLPWIETTIAVAPANTKTMWDELYAAIREGGRYSVTLDQAVAVMAVIKQARS